MDNKFPSYTMITFQTCCMDVLLDPQRCLGWVESLGKALRNILEYLQYLHLQVFFCLMLAKSVTHIPYMEHMGNFLESFYFF